MIKVKNDSTLLSMSAHVNTLRERNREESNGEAGRDIDEI